MGEDSILKRLQAAIAACPYVAGAYGPLLVDYIRESEPCCGIFPAGEKRLFADWAGNERWQYDFTIQMTGYGLQEKERAENEAFAERLGRWSSGLKKDAIDLGKLGRFESLWTGQGRLLYPAKDGQTFIYALEGRLFYQRRKEDTGTRTRWFFGFGPERERVWTECAAGIDRLQREKAQGRWLYDFDGLKRKGESETGAILLSGCFWPEDPFQQRAARQPAGEEVLWVCAVCNQSAEAVPARGGLCTILAGESFEANPQSAGTVEIKIQLLTGQRGFFWMDGQKNGSFLPERPGNWGDFHWSGRI